MDFIYVVTDSPWFWLTAGLYGIAYLCWTVIHVALALYRWVV